MSTALLEQPVETVGAPVLSEPSALPPRNNVMAALTGIVIVGPIVALTGVMLQFWGTAVSLRDIVIAVVLYAIAGHGVTVGFHRLFAHQALQGPPSAQDRARRWPGRWPSRAASSAWVANHRLPPHVRGPARRPPLARRRRLGRRRPAARAVARAHGLVLPTAGTWPRPATPPTCWPTATCGWSTRLFPLVVRRDAGVAVRASGGSWAGRSRRDQRALLWAGGVRIGVLHHMTWSINSDLPRLRPPPVQHRRPERQRGGAVGLSMGESWHNAHHAFPALGPPRRRPRPARHLGRHHPHLRTRRLGPRRPLARPHPPRRQTPLKSASVGVRLRFP